MSRLSGTSTTQYFPTPPEVVTRVAALVRPAAHGGRVAVRPRRGVHRYRYYLVTAGEERRRAQLLRAKHYQIHKDEPVRCVVDVTGDPLEVSLDENVIPAPQ